MKNPETTHIFHAKGMHCHSCVVLTESEIRELPGVLSVSADLSSLTVRVSGYFGERSAEDLASEFSKRLRKHGYSLVAGTRKEEILAERKNNLDEFKKALPFAAAVILGFVLLQKAGFVNLIGGEEMTLGTAFLIGAVASLSSCAAVVGGLLLSLSATFAKEGNVKTPQILFHSGRFLSFFFLGGAIGLFGASFQLGIAGTFVLGVSIGLIMLAMGVNLLDVFHSVKKFQPSMPRFVSERALRVAKFEHSATPFLAGVATFFLPCGFTQSMQIATLASGGFLRGALTMSAFALGTFPVLLAISLSAMRAEGKKASGVFFKTAGIIVIAFALFNIINSFVIIGLLSPVFSF